MNKIVKGIVIAAGVLILAVFYVLFADGKALLAQEEELILEDGEVLTSYNVTQKRQQEETAEVSGESEKTDTLAQSEGERTAEGGTEGLSETEKEEIRQIVAQCLREELSEAVRASLKENMDRMLEEGSLAPAAEHYLETQSALVNINTADQEGLMSLPGIGKAKAAAILSYRQENGKFSSLEQLTNVSGISASLLEKIRELITL